MKVTPATIESDGHVVMTGPITGNVILADGTVVDVGPPVIEVSDAQAAEVAHLIGQRYAAEGHPHDVEVDEKTGKTVQRPFVYDPPTKKKGR